MSVSYSQLGQDTAVIDFYKNKKGGFFIEIGAYDGILLSNTYILEYKLKWKGICVEPIPSQFHKLQLNRIGSICENKAVHSESGELPFLIAKSNDLLSGLSQTINAHEKTIQNNSQTIQVKTISLQELLHKHNAPSFIEYLSIDAAGAELNILQSVDFKAYTFGLIDIQHNYKEPIRSDIRKLLLANGYEYIKENKWDDCYKHSSVSLFIHREDCCPKLFSILNSMKSPKGKITVTHRLDNRHVNTSDSWNVFISSEPELPIKEYDLYILPFQSNLPNAINYPFLYMALAEMRQQTFERVHKTEFCAFLYYKNYKHRDDIFHKLNSYKKVHSLGKACNNMHIQISRHVYNADESFYDIAVQLYSRYKFVLAVENCWKEGYFTEKILLPLFAHSIPIYWGHPSVFEYINKKRVIYLSDFPTNEDLFQHLEKIMNDDALYESILKEEWYTDIGKPENVDNRFIMTLNSQIESYKLRNTNLELP